MIIYDKSEKELVIPDGLGNLQAGGGSCEGVYQQGFNDGVRNQKAKLSSTAITENGEYTRADGWNSVYVNVSGSSCEGVYEEGFADGYTSGSTDGYEVGWREGFESGATSTSGTAYQQGYNVGWQDGVSDGKAMVARDAISLSFSANGEWYKDVMDDIYANEVVVNVKQELVQSFMVRFKGIQPLQPSDIVGCSVAGKFTINSAITYNGNNTTILSVYGHPSEHMARLDYIRITIPTSVYSQWSELSANAMSFNGTKGSGDRYEGGITFAPYSVSSLAEGDNTHIYVYLNNN